MNHIDESQRGTEAIVITGNMPSEIAMSENSIFLRKQYSRLTPATRGSRKVTVLTVFIILLTACCSFNRYMDSFKSPSLGYPLSHYNVENYDNQYSHASFRSMNAPNSALNMDGVVVAAAGETISNVSPTSKIQYKNSGDMLPNVITKKTRASAIFGPFQSQLPDQFELYNTHSLILVALMFIFSFLLLS